MPASPPKKYFTCSDKYEREDSRHTPIYQGSGGQSFAPTTRHRDVSITKYTRLEHNLTLALLIPPSFQNLPRKYQPSRKERNSDIRRNFKNEPGFCCAYFILLSSYILFCDRFSPAARLLMDYKVAHAVEDALQVLFFQ